MSKNPSDILLLLVDDDLSIRKLIKTICMSFGIKKIIEAADGRDAVQLLKNPPASRPGESLSKRKFDCIVSDWMMPDMTGIELLRHVRKDPKYIETPFILLTAERDQDNVRQAIEAGCDDYIIKPFTSDDLEKKLRRLLF
ncbi:MAG TPA: response regulator [Oligoflexia bacterium]|nr:response regulator [Oligoflexia bacterium]HMP49347.1 response regulator [Oligoflexia bacterium]